MMDIIGMKFILFVWMGIAVFSLVFLIINIIKALQRKSQIPKRKVFTTLAIMLLTAASFINIGWFRVIMLWLLIPVIHATVFFVSNMFFVKYTDISPQIKIMNLMFMISYLVAYLFLPDFGDIGGAYFFFTLIQNEILVGIAFFVSQITFVGHIVLFILQIIEVRKIRKFQKHNLIK